MKVYLATPHSYMNVFLALANAGGGGYVFKDAPKERLMDIYLAGGATGNNKAIWRNNYEIPEKAMNIFLAAYSTPFGDKAAKQAEKEMNVHLVDMSKVGNKELVANKIYVLESFYYMQDWMLPYIKNHWHFLLDSGAFTFFGKDNNVNWKEYIKKYAEFINKYNIELFFELDLDNIIGINKTRDLRKYLEDLTQKQSIPVWRPFRGKDYWYEMIENYNYIAISASGEYDSKWTRKKNAIPIISKLLKEAHTQKTKVHGLGYTKIEGLLKLKWDSVDSTSWIYGNRSGFLYKFNGKTIDKIQKPKGTRLKSKEAAIHNFKEWIKFQKYAKHNL